MRVRQHPRNRARGLVAEQIVALPTVEDTRAQMDTNCAHLLQYTVCPFKEAHIYRTLVPKCKDVAKAGAAGSFKLQPGAFPSLPGGLTATKSKPAVPAKRGSSAGAAHSEVGE